MSDPAAQDGSLPLTREQAVLIVSRAITCYLLFWAVSDIIGLPHEILTVTHELLGPSSLGFSTLSAFKASYYTRYYILNLAANVLSIALLLTAAGWFYRCGPRIRNFFAAMSE